MTTSAPRVSKKKLTLAQAADQFERASNAKKLAEAEIEEAKAVLVTHFEKSGRSTYKDRIAFALSTRNVLDQAKVREFLGAQLADFQKITTIRSVTLLKKT